jgi:hypothetical protein
MYRYYLFFFILFFSCRSGKEAADNSSIANKSGNMADISQSTGNFLYLLNQEKQQLGMDNFTPSEEMIQKYRLRKFDEQYYIAGMIKVEEGFDNQKLKDLKVRTGTEAGQIITVHMPIHKIEEIRRLQGVNYIQINDPVHLRN